MKHRLWLAFGLLATVAGVAAARRAKSEHFTSTEIGTDGRIDRSKARISKAGFMFEPFPIEGPGTALADVQLADEEELMLVERGEEKILLRLNEMTYHHVAQGELGGEPFAVSF